MIVTTIGLLVCVPLPYSVFKEPQNRHAICGNPQITGVENCLESQFEEILNACFSNSAPIVLKIRKIWWAWIELNYRPRPYQGRALAT